MKICWVKILTAVAGGSTGVYVGVSLFGGMERWNGIVEWNGGMTTPTDRVLSRPIPTIFQNTAVFSSL